MPGGWRWWRGGCCETGGAPATNSPIRSARVGQAFEGTSSTYGGGWGLMACSAARRMVAVAATPVSEAGRGRASSKQRGGLGEAGLPFAGPFGWDGGTGWPCQAQGPAAPPLTCALGVVHRRGVYMRRGHRFGGSWVRRAVTLSICLSFCSPPMTLGPSRGLSLPLSLPKSLPLRSRGPVRARATCTSSLARQWIPSRPTHQRSAAAPRPESGRIGWAAGARDAPVLARRADAADLARRATRPGGGWLRAAARLSH